MISDQHNLTTNSLAALEQTPYFGMNEKTRWRLLLAFKRQVVIT